MLVKNDISKNALLPNDIIMPDWTELTSILAKDAGTPEGTHAPHVAQRYEQRFGRVQLIEAIREALHSDKARPGMSHRCFVKLPFDTIYTTNFDLLIEDAYSEAIKPFRSLVGEHQLPFHAGQIASSIVKMHGDLRHEEHIIITQNDYESFMERYPVIATHLAAMLITRTPLFIGYSLTDPDFENIRKVVRARLGVFERMAYVVQFDVDEKDIESALDKKLHIISLDSSSGPTRDDVLAQFLTDIQNQIDIKAGTNLRDSRPDIFENIEREVVQKELLTPRQSHVTETTSRLCFVMMPFSKRFDEIYRMLIAPAAQDNGLTTLRADEMAGPGFIMEQIRTAMQQSRLCIADLTGCNSNVLYEIGYAQALGKPLVLIAEQGSQLPFDVTHQRIIFYDASNFLAAKKMIQKAISIVLSANRLEEAFNLLELEQYRGAIASGAIVLEQRLIDSLSSQQLDREMPRTLSGLISTARDRNLINVKRYTELDKVRNFRNKAVHWIEEPTKEEAHFVLNTIREVLEDLPERE